MPDVVVIGSGPNGLVSACVLARAGLDVVVLEANDRPGGAAWTSESTLPGFRHDVGAGFFPFGQLSPAFKELDLEGAGLSFLHAPIDSAHPARDGSCAVMGRDIERCAELLGEEDGGAFSSWANWWAGVGDRLLPALLATVPAIREGLRVPPLAALRLAGVAASSGRGFAEATFASEHARRMIPALALHTDVAPSDAFGAIVGFMLAMTSTTGGFAVAAGGANAITNALLVRLAQRRGRVECGTRARRIVIEGARAVAVDTNQGLVRAKVGIIAATAAPTLFLELLPSQHVPPSVLDRMRSFPFGFGTFKMDWALAGAVPWKAESCREAAVVHTGESLDDLDRFAAEVRGGRMPEDPYIVIGQQSLVDPTRAPKGKHTLYAYSRVPSDLPGGGWTGEAKDVFARRIERRIEELAPGFRDLVLAKVASAPPDLQAMDENLLRGDLGGGSAAITNQLVFRPMFPYFRYRTPVRGVYLGSSYAHPGAGVHGMCGLNAAKALLADAR